MQFELARAAGHLVSSHPFEQLGTWRTPIYLNIRNHWVIIIILLGILLQPFLVSARSTIHFQAWVYIRLILRMTIWVQNLFGDFLGVICEYFNWISGATDKAIYPALIVSYLSGNNLEGFQRFFYASAICLVLAGLSFLGLGIVGNASFIICVVITMSPFIIMTFLGGGSIDPSRWFQLTKANGS